MHNASKTSRKKVRLENIILGLEHQYNKEESTKNADD